MCKFSRLYYEAIERQKESTFKKWIKLIPPNKLVRLVDYDRKDDFIKVANIILDRETKRDGTKKRQTEIRFDWTIDEAIWKEKCEWLYLFVIDGEIVKIGGTRDGLKNRCSSYNCGHHIPERGKSGDCSKTNAFVYNTMAFYLDMGFQVEMYGYRLEPVKLTVPIFEDETCEVTAQTYHAYESKYIQRFKYNYGFLPHFCDNCDPCYRD